MDPRAAALQGDPAALHAWAERVGEELRDALRAVLDALPGAPAGAVPLAKRLGLNRDIAGRILLALPRDPLGVLDVIPGPEPLRRFLGAADERGADPAALARARQAVDDFQSLIHDGCGTRDGLAALLSASVREIRERLELAARSAAFRGVSQLHGASARLWIDLKMLAVCGSDPERCDAALVSGPIGLQRLRPDADVRLCSHAPRRAPTGDDGDIIIPLGDLAEFCPHRVGCCEVVQHGGDVRYRLVDPSVGPRGLMDLLAGDMRRDVLPRRYTPEGLRARGGVQATSSVIPDVPSQMLVSDLFVEEGLYGEVEPVPVVLRNVGTEVMEVFDEKAEALRAEPLERVEPLGPAPEDWALDEIPGYPGLVRHVGERLGGAGRRFRGYRLRVPYPVASWQYVITLRPVAR